MPTRVVERRSEAALFSVSNHHTEQCGKPPAIDGDDLDAYHGYFENRHGEQWVFIYQRDTGEGTLYGGDVGWEARPVVGGKVDGLILASEEKTWLQACWQAATLAG